MSEIKAMQRTQDFMHWSKYAAPEDRNAPNVIHCKSGCVNVVSRSAK